MKVSIIFFTIFLTSIKTERCSYYNVEPYLVTLAKTIDDHYNVMHVNIASGFTAVDNSINSLYTKLSVSSSKSNQFTPAQVKNYLNELLSLRNLIRNDFQEATRNTISLFNNILKSSFEDLLDAAGYACLTINETANGVKSKMDTYNYNIQQSMKTVQSILSSCVTTAVYRLKTDASNCDYNGFSLVTNGVISNRDNICNGASDEASFFPPCFEGFSNTYMTFIPAFVEYMSYKIGKNGPNDKKLLKCMNGALTEGYNAIRTQLINFDNSMNISTGNLEGVTTTTTSPTTVITSCNYI